MIVKEYLWPKRILMQTGDITYGENLKIEVPRQILIGTPSKEYTRINGRASILLDFGIEARAALRILCRTVERADGIGTTRVRIRLGESASECCAELGERGACNDHSPRDFEIVLTGMSDNCWGQSGFRFARLDFLDDDVVVNIHAILADQIPDAAAHGAALEPQELRLVDTFGTNSLSLGKDGIPHSLRGVAVATAA